jgi:restriction system protein
MAIIRLMTRELSRPRRAVPSPWAPASNGRAFEAQVAQALAAAGWSTRSIGGSGDQGADIIAEAGHVRLIVQCKDLARPAGTRAVQEALAGRVYHRGDIAAVVCRSGFTPGAKNLAHRADVRLWGPSHLLAPHVFLK